MKPICVPCQRFYRVKQNGFMFIEAMPITTPTKPGTAEPEKWKPYKLWRGDLWECPTCGHQTVSGVAFQPVSEHYLPDFAAEAKASKLTVNDC